MLLGVELPRSATMSGRDDGHLVPIAFGFRQLNDGVGYSRVGRRDLLHHHQPGAVDH